MNRTQCGLTVLFMVLVLFLSQTTKAEENSAYEKILNIYNWSEYFAADTISDFEAETGIAVRYDSYDSDEALDAKLLVGSTGYDLVFPGNSYLATQIKAGIYQKINKTKLSNYSHLDPSLLSVMTQSDPANEHGVPYMWGTIGVAYDQIKVKALLDNKLPENKLALIFAPQYSDRLKKCGVAVMDSANGVIPLALSYLGRDPLHPNDRDYRDVLEMLLKVRPNIRQFVSDATPKGLIDGDICITIAYNGGALVAAKMAKDINSSADLVYAIPTTGSPMWFDSMAIPKDAPHVANAHAFINYILRPDVVAKISNAVQYASANATAQKLVAENLRSNTGIYPSESTRKTLWVQAAKSLEEARKETRVWTKFKTWH